MISIDTYIYRIHDELKFWYEHNKERIKQINGHYLIDGKTGNDIEDFIESPEGKYEILDYVDIPSSVRVSGLKNAKEGDYIVAELYFGKVKSWCVGYKFGKNRLEQQAKQRFSEHPNYSLGRWGREANSITKYNNHDEVYIISIILFPEGKDDNNDRKSGT